MGTAELVVIAICVLGLALIVGIARARAAHRVPEHHVSLVERFGNYHRTLQPGRHWVIQGMDAVRATVDLRPQVLDLPNTMLYTADDKPVSVNATVHFAIVDPTRAVYEIHDHRALVEQTALFALRNGAAARSLDQILDSPGDIHNELVAQMNEHTARFGITVSRVDLNTISPMSDDDRARHIAASKLAMPGFTVVLRGYDKGQVDDIMRRAVEALQSDRPDRGAAAGRALREPLRIRLRGYDRHQVDRALAALAGVAAQV